MSARFLGWALTFGVLGSSTAAPPPVLRPFQLPTANQALFDSGGEERFFVGTLGKPWTSGTFGCVRTGGNQLHEGLDIRCVQRDRQGEPTDPVCATADGTVAYINAKPSLSNFGRYVVVRHLIDGIEIYSTYAHLRDVRADLRPGLAVKAGEAIAKMGRSANTREGISKDRAHVHFELNLMVNDRFAVWRKKTSPEQRNDHGNWNGQNFLGLDPRAILLAERAQGDRFRLLQFIQSRPVLCRVQVRAKDFPWVRRYRALVRPNPKCNREGVAGYELALTFNGLALEAIPRPASELRGRSRYVLLSLDEREQQRNPCGHLLTHRSGRWELSSQGIRLLDLLTY